MHRPVQRAEPPVSRSSVASVRNNTVSSDSLAKEFSDCLDKNTAGNTGSAENESTLGQNLFGDPGGSDPQALSDDALAELARLRDDDVPDYAQSSSGGTETGNTPLFCELLELSLAQLHTDSMDATTAASRGVVDTAVELLMAEFRRFDTQRNKRTWQFTLDGSGIEVEMNLQKSDDGGWFLRLNLPQGHGGFNKQEILEDLRARMHAMDQQIELEVEIGVPA